MAQRRAVQRAGCRSIPSLSRAERRSAWFVRLGTEPAEIFQLRRILAVPETNRGTRRAGGQARGRATLCLPKRDPESAKPSRPLSKSQEQSSARAPAEPYPRTESVH